MMREIAERYKGKKTGSGHDLRVDDMAGRAILWYLFWGEYQGADDHHHMGIASVSREGGAYSVGWLRGTEQEPFRASEYTTAEELFAALDKEIAGR